MAQEMIALIINMKDFLIISGMFILMVGGGALIGGEVNAFILFLGWCWITYEYLYSA